MIICRPGTAAAAGPLILTAAAAPGILQGAQLIQHLTVLPYLIKRRLAHIPQLHIEISTRLHLAPWANYTISRSCQTTSAEAGFQAHLGSNPQKLRCTGRLQLNLHLLLLLHNPRQSVLISLRPERFRLNSLRPACRHQKEEVMCHRPLCHGKIRQVLQLVIVPLHHRGMNLKRQSCRPAVAHALHRPFPGPREFAELVVLLPVHRVKGNPHAHGPGSLQLLCHLQGNQRAVGAEDRPQPQAGSIGHQLHNIRPHKRLAAGKNHNLEACPGNLLQKRLCLRRGQFFLRLAACIPVAVVAVHIAGISGIPRNNHQLLPPFMPISSSVR